MVILLMIHLLELIKEDFLSNLIHVQKVLYIQLLDDL